MTLAQLRYFLALAEAGQYTLAAERLHIAQPSLSYAIRELENDLGFPLFRRGGRHVALTPCGEQFLRYATRALNTLDEGVRLTRQMAHPDTGTVALGYFHSISADLIPRLVERFYAAHADSPITFRFSQHLNSVILDELKRGKLDLAIECADGAFECFFADSETSADGVGVTGVGEGQAAAGSAQGVEELVGKVAEAFHADGA